MMVPSELGRIKRGLTLDKVLVWGEQQVIIGQ